MRWRKEVATKCICQSFNFDDIIAVELFFFSFVGGFCFVIFLDAHRTIYSYHRSVSENRFQNIWSFIFVMVCCCFFFTRQAIVFNFAPETRPTGNWINVNARSPTDVNAECHNFYFVRSGWIYLPPTHLAFNLFVAWFVDVVVFFGAVGSLGNDLIKI